MFNIPQYSRTGQMGAPSLSQFPAEQMGAPSLPQVPAEQPSGIPLPPVVGEATKTVQQIIDGIQMWRKSYGEVQKWATERVGEPKPLIDTDTMRKEANRIFEMILDLTRTPFTKWLE